jgi:hypothetical protein
MLANNEQNYIECGPARFRANCIQFAKVKHLQKETYPNEN